ncbi:Na-translocating system protein MpsC family protein [Bacillaceae bacterium S4-13-56]
MVQRKFEEEISSVISKFRKEITGRGPIDTISKVIGHTIYVKLNVAYSSHEKNLYKVVKNYNGLEEVCELYAHDFRGLIDGILTDFGFSTHVDHVLIYPDIDHDYIYCLIVLKKNLEKELIKNLGTS